MIVIGTILGVLILILLLYVYARYIFRWSDTRLANICIAKFSTEDLQKGNDSYGTRYNDGSYFGYSNIKINRDVQPPQISIDIEVRDKESQKVLDTIPTKYSVFTDNKSCGIIDYDCIVV